MVKKNIVRRLKNKYILNLLSKRKLEDLDVISKVEKFFVEKRGYMVKIPKEGSSVILIVSGGMDSVMVWAYLMKVYKLKVYPVFFRRGQRRVKLEEAAVDYFYKFYRKKYPDYCEPVQKMNAFIPPMEIRFPITIASNEIKSKKGKWMGIPMYSNILFSYAVQYAYFLQITKKVKVRSIFSGFMATDGLVMKDETLTAMRMNNLEISILTDDFDWQVIALPLEKEIGFFYGKEEFIKWASLEGIPLEKTRSCIMWGKLQCGDCISCRMRKYTFGLAGVEDKTVYKNALPPFRRRLKRLLKKAVLSILR